jgi:two-component system LytT family response regulator
METYKTIIVDDEDLARAVVREACDRYPSISVVAECPNGFEAVKAITELSPDIVFLDIQMPKLNGFEVLDLVEGNFAVVFITAHEEHALKAFDANALDYLLKPFSHERFDKAIHKAFDMLRTDSGASSRAKGAALAHPEGLLDRILIREGGSVRVLTLDQISHIEAQDDYIAIVSGGKKFLKQQTMKQIESHLPPQRFVRIHRSTLLNIDFLSRIELYTKDSRVVILTDATRLHVSRAGYDRLKQYLEG